MTDNDYDGVLVSTSDFDKERISSYRTVIRVMSDILLSTDVKPAEIAALLMDVFTDLIVYGSDDTVSQFLRVRQQSSTDEIMSLFAQMRKDLQPDTAVTGEQLAAMFQV